MGDYAVISRTGATRTVEYLLKDRLGSVDAVASSSGTVTETRGYDAFGKPRDGSWNDLTPAKIATTAVTPKGFTQHEHLNQLELIHMNGRAYDYHLGRFTGVDPFIQFPLNSQSLNPYSYILNNPLSGTDPTGYASEPTQDCHSAGSAGACSYTETGSRIQKQGTIGSDSKGKAAFTGAGAVGGRLITSTGSISAHGNVNGASSGQNTNGASSRKEQASAASEKNAAGNASNIQSGGNQQAAAGGLPAPGRDVAGADGRVSYVDDSGHPIPTYPSLGDGPRERSFRDAFVDFFGDARRDFWDKVLPALPGEGQLVSASGIFYKVPYYARSIKASDLGLQGSTTLLRGQYVFNRGVITIRVDMIRGDYSNVWHVFPLMIENARKAGGKTLVIEGTLGNPSLHRVLQRLGAKITTEGKVDRIVFNVR